jgi:hypothetical protein
MRSDLTKPPQWYVVTRYRIKNGIDPKTGEAFNYMVAVHKYDVTDQMQAILERETQDLERRNG